MPDNRFYNNTGPLALSDITALSRSKSEVPSEKSVLDIADLATATEQDIVFYDNPRMRPQLDQCKAAACITKENLAGQVPAHMTAIIADNPRHAFAEVARRFYPEKKPIHYPDRIHASAKIDSPGNIASTAQIGADVKLGRHVHIGHNVVIRDGVKIDDDSIIEDGVIIGEGVELGKKCRIGSHCSITHTIAGDNVAIAPGTRIGIAGYGFEITDKGGERLPHLGIVDIGDKVEIDANCTIERGMLSPTRIGSGTKIGSQVMVGHTVQIGKDCAIYAQSGIAGSTVIGDKVQLWSQSGIGDHCNIGNGAVVMPQAGVVAGSIIPSGVTVMGSPAKHATREDMRALAAARTALTGQAYEK